MKFVTAYQHLGCFQDTSDRALSTMMTDHHGYYSVELCFNACNDAHYQYFALQTGNQCFCDNSYANATRYGPSSACSGGTGGSWAFDLYEIGMIFIHIFS